MTSGSVYKGKKTTKMAHFTDGIECINYSKYALDQYPSLKELMVPADFDIWADKLNRCSNIRDFLLGNAARLNLLNVSTYVGFNLQESVSDPFSDHCKIVLAKCELYLKAFPGLKSNKSFKTKIKNIDTLSFLSTLSELSLAYELKKYGLSVKFESKFKQLTTQKDRDVDISASDINNNEMHFEVYMPNKQSETNGFFDFTEDVSHFERKIGHKLIDKFGQDGISGLNGTILLAINKIFFDTMHIRTALPFFESGYENLIKLIPDGIDGLFIYEDGFGSDNSFKFENIVLKT